MPTFAYKHVKMVSQCPTTTHTRHESRDQPTTGTQHVLTSLFRGFAFSTAIAAICRRSQPATADLVVAARGGACWLLESCCGRDRLQHPSASRRITCRRARSSAPLVGAPTRQRCAAHAPPQRRRPAPSRHAKAIEWPCWLRGGGANPGIRPNGPHGGRADGAPIRRSEH